MLLTRSLVTGQIYLLSLVLMEVEKPMGVFATHRFHCFAGLWQSVSANGGIATPLLLLRPCPNPVVRSPFAYLQLLFLCRNFFSGHLVDYYHILSLQNSHRILWSFLFLLYFWLTVTHKSPISITLACLPFLQLKCIENYFKTIFNSCLNQFYCFS